MVVVSQSAVCPQVYCVEVVTEDGGEYESFPWQSHESSPSEVLEKNLQPGQEMQTRPTIGEWWGLSCSPSYIPLPHFTS